MASQRRFGAESSATRAALLDAVLTVMRKDGYGSLTARSVAECAALKHQLVYYYFQTLDDLLVAAYDRHIDRYRTRMEQAMQSDRPLHSFWQVHANPEDAALNLEFLALANHNEAIRQRTAAFGEEVRRIGLEQINRFNAPGSGEVTPFAVTMVIAAIGSVLGLETAIGITGGHAETRRLIEWCIDQLEP